MFGIGLPELLVILALALIVVGPEKLPDLARSLAKGLFELKKTANSLRDTIQDEMDEVGKEVKPWERLSPDRLPYTKEPPSSDTVDQEPPVTESNREEQPLETEANLKEESTEANLEEEPLGTEANLEEQQERVILPEEESREHPSGENEDKAAS